MKHGGHLKFVGCVESIVADYQSVAVSGHDAFWMLKNDPWENLTGDPRGTDRLADRFPLTGVLNEFHWRPGDGVRFSLPASASSTPSRDR